MELNELSEAEWQKGFGLYTRYDRALGIDDIAATISAARKIPGASGKVGVLGYCFGGLMTFLIAARGHPDAAVAYHGSETEKYLSEVKSIKAPLLMHLAEEDGFIPSDAQEQIKQALATSVHSTVHSYPGQRHAFARHNGAHYDAGAARLANERTMALFSQALGISSHA